MKTLRNLLIAALASLVGTTVASAADNAWFTLENPIPAGVSVTSSGPGQTLVINKPAGPGTTTLTIGYNFSNTMQFGNPAGMAAWGFTLDVIDLNGGTSIVTAGNGDFGPSLAAGYNLSIPNIDPAAALFSAGAVSFANGGGDGLVFLFDIVITKPDGTPKTTDIFGDLDTQVTNFGYAWFGNFGPNTGRYGLPNYNSRVGELPVITILNNPATGACCLPDGTCVETILINCSGDYQGDGTTCGPIGDCCLVDGSCAILNEICCMAVGGTFGGVAIECGVVPEEACCLPNGSCVDAIPKCCNALFGTPQGAGTTCAPGNGACCDPPKSVEPKWTQLPHGFGASDELLGSQPLPGGLSQVWQIVAPGGPDTPLGAQPVSALSGLANIGTALVGTCGHTGFGFVHLLTCDGVLIGSRPPTDPSVTAMPGASTAPPAAVVFGFTPGNVYTTADTGTGVSDSLFDIGPSGAGPDINIGTLADVLGFPILGIDGLAFDKSTGRLYGSTGFTSFPTSHLVEISSLGVVTDLGPILVGGVPPAVPVAGLAYSGGRLYGSLGGGFGLGSGDLISMPPGVPGAAVFDHNVTGAAGGGSLAGLTRGCGGGFNVASDVDWQTLTQQLPGDPGPGPNWVVADDFRSDGRPITCVAWWGSYLDYRFQPVGGGAGIPGVFGACCLDDGSCVDVLDEAACIGLGGTVFFPGEFCIDQPCGSEIDGWLVSFHTDLPADQAPGTFSQPLDLLGLYFCPEPAVQILETNIVGWDGHCVFEYFVELQDCHLLHSLIDSRPGATPPDPARSAAFLETADFIYWLDIQAVVGHTYVNDPIAGWIEVPTQNFADDHFWGWHTSPDHFNDESVMGTVVMGPGGEWLYPSWEVVDGSAHQPACLCLGDMDGNGILNGLDIQGFVECILGTAPAGTVCACADLDGNGVVDIADVAGFVTRLLQKTPCSQFQLFVDQAFELLTPRQVGACCISPTACVLVSEIECVECRGGVYLGDKSECPTTTVRVVTHTATQWSHFIGTVVDCPVPGARGVAGCTDQPFEIDPWTTEPGGTSCEDFSHPDACPIPADFFGPGSDPFTGQVCFEGVPLGNTPFGDFGDADTLVQRTASPFDRCDVSVPFPTPPVNVSIEVVALNLLSVNPITVTFNGGQNPEAWDVEVTLSDIPNPSSGMLSAIKTHCNGGTYDSTLSVTPKFTFTRVSDQMQLTLDAGLGGCLPIDMSTIGDTWVHDPHPNSGVMNPVCTDFFPGVDDLIPVDQSTCDCDGNGIRDACEQDSDGDGVTDACDPCTDVDGDGFGQDVGNGINCPNGATPDCDDGDATVNPNGVEAGNCADGKDNDCDTLIDCADTVDCPPAVPPCP